MGFRWGYNKCHADVAQPEEQRFRKPQVKGSSPFIGSIIEYKPPQNWGGYDIVYHKRFG